VDLVLVDPPRTGLPPRLREALAKAKPPRILYLSCDPATLARDSASLIAAGYALEGLRVYDFFPQTSHLECAARFGAKP
jgi:23S rRNA (uracil1939-C5)-methyltransferase